MFVCLCLRLRAYLPACVHACSRLVVCVHVRVRACLCLNMRAHVHACVRACLSLDVRVHVDVRANKHVCVHM